MVRLTTALTAIRPKVARVRAGAVLLGPAFVASIAYVDPGNVATNVTAGARFGYLLVWVVVVANLMACLVQFLSAKLGLVTGMSLPQALRERMSRPVRLAYWGQAELVAMATDLAEVLGGAIALRILFGVPLLLGGVLTGVVSVALLTTQNRYGQSTFERVSTGLLVVVAVGFVAGMFVSAPSPPAITGGLLPGFDGTDSVLLAAGMLGATVMPHAVYLHSALARDRHGRADGARLSTLLRATKVDVGAAMLLAGAVNLAMLLLAASALRGTRTTDSLSGAHSAVSQDLGPTVALLFALGLLASGLASTAVGCYAGAVIMDGLLRRRVPLLARRVITLVPALTVLAAGVDPTRAMVISQVVLSFGIPLALVPLVVLTARRDVMGSDVNSRWTTATACVVAAAVVTLNLALIHLTLTGTD